MRRWLALSVAALTLTAGCLGVGDTEEPRSADATGGAQADLPEPIYDERKVEGKTSPLGSSQGQPCKTDTSTCYSYPFESGSETRLQARLDWTNATNDFDLHVLDEDGDKVASSDAGGLGTVERLDTTLEPGSYELVVVAWLVPQDTYTLEAQFGYP